jgi:protein Tex
MNDAHIATIAVESGIHLHQVRAVASLLTEGASIPFISRYRKEATGSLDEVAVSSIRDRLTQLADLDARREAILKSLEQHGHLTDELRDQVAAATILTELEDIYLPYRPKRRTRATKAREKGLEPLAETLFAQTGVDPKQMAADFVDSEKEVLTAVDALAGARDIMAEWISENADARSALRALFENRGCFRSTVATGKEREAVKFRDYFDWEEPVAKAPSHRILAMRRGEKEDFLNLTVAPPEAEAVEWLEQRFVTGDGADAEQVRLAVADSYKRLLSRSMETEIRLFTKQRADTEAIRVFADNLRQLLLAPPLGPKRVMGIDPGFRTGCKVVCLDRQGKLLDADTIYPHTSKHNTRAAQTLVDLCGRFAIEAVAVGNGTAGRETEAFVRAAGLPQAVQVAMVNESGASIYSASEAAREEFPDHDLTVRGAVSIGRRLMDPLSELVKIDPKSIGVGQYQHDVDQTALKDSLDDVVASCVNGVGVDLNRASAQLLTYVSGLGPRLARNIVAYRNENGPFDSRKAIRKVPRLGPKAFEQSAGFLRIADGKNPLDASAVHPESYHIVVAMAADLDCSVGDLMTSADQRGRIDLKRYVTDSVGLPTLKDIQSELAKPGRDPRDEFEAFAFASGVEKPADLRTGMRLPGIVTNITAFGAFVDIGVHQDGLVHISQMADRFVRDPAEVVKVSQQVRVTVLEVDLERNRIALSMKSAPEKGERKKPKAPGKRPPLKKGKRSASGPAPFNNPFAEAFSKKK